MFRKNIVFFHLHVHYNDLIMMFFDEQVNVLIVTTVQIYRSQATFVNLRPELAHTWQITQKDVSLVSLIFWTTFLRVIHVATECFEMHTWNHIHSISTGRE